MGTFRALNYRVFFLTVPPKFLYRNEKRSAANQFHEILDVQKILVASMITLAVLVNLTIKKINAELALIALSSDKSLQETLLFNIQPAS